MQCAKQVNTGYKPCKLAFFFGLPSHSPLEQEAATAKTINARDWPSTCQKRLNRRQAGEKKTDLHDGAESGHVPESNERKDEKQPKSGTKLREIGMPDDGACESQSMQCKKQLRSD